MKKATHSPLSEVKEFWEAWPADKPKPFRTVVKAMHEAGLTISVSTLQRWVDCNWTTGHIDARTKAARAERAKKKPAESSEKLSKKTVEHERKVSRLDSILAEEAEMKAERERLLSDMKLDSDLAALAMRESLIAQIILARQITRRAAVLMDVAPEVAADLMKVLKGPAASTTIVIPPNEAPSTQSGNGDGARVVDGKVIAKSESQMAIESFKNRRMQGIAA